MRRQFVSLKRATDMLELSLRLPHGSWAERAITDLVRAVASPDGYVWPQRQGAK